MESEEEFFDAQEYLTEPETFTTPVSTVISISHKHKKLSEFSHIKIIKELSLPFSSESWLMRFNPEGTHVAISGNQGTILIYSLSYPELIHSPVFLTEHSYDITSLSWSNNQTLLSGSIDHTIKEWAISPKSLHTFNYHCKILAVEYLPQDNNFFIAAFEDYVIRNIYIPNKQIVNSVQLFEDIMCLSVSESGGIAAVGMDKGKVIPFRIRETDFKLIDRPILYAKNKRGFLKSGKKVTGIRFLSDDEMLVTTMDSNVRLYNLQNYQLTQKYKGSKMTTRSFCAENTYDNKCVVCGSERSKFLIWKTVLDMELKNKKYESVKIQREKTPEYVFPAPKSVCDRINMHRAEKSFNYILFSLDTANLLKIYRC